MALRASDILSMLLGYTLKSGKRSDKDKSRKLVQEVFIATFSLSQLSDFQRFEFFINFGYQSMRLGQKAENHGSRGAKDRRQCKGI